jgi:alpha-beta hydrolase superfamily lysophospholipase
MKEIKMKNGLSLKIFEADNPNGTCLFLMHGMVEHLGRYSALINYLNDKGVAVSGFHYPGHGENKLLGVMEPEMIEGVLESILEAHRILKTEGFEKIIHFAHSMGTYFTRLLITELDVDHIILSGVPYIDEKKVRNTIRLVRTLGKVMPRKWTSKKMLAMVFDDFLKPYKNVKNGHEFISTLENEQLRYIEDPLCGIPISIGFVELLLELSSRVIALEETLSEINIPVTLMSGKDDSIGNMGEALKDLANYYSKRSDCDYEVALFEGRHEVLNDIGSLAMMEKILSIS